MITPTNPTVASNTYVGWERTNAIANLGNYFGEYYLGWMYYDNIPSMFHATEFLTSDNTLVARDITSQANAPVAYITAPDGLNTIRATYYDNFTVNNVGNTPCYLNGIYAQSVNMRYNDGSVTGVEGFGIAVYAEYGNDESLGTYNKKIEITGRRLGLTNFSKLLDFLYGNTDVSYAVTIGGQSITFTLNAADLEPDGYVTVTGTQNGVYYRMVIFIYQYGISTGFTVDPDSTGQGREYQILPTLKMSSSNGDYWVTSQSGLFSRNFFNLDNKSIIDNGQTKMGTIGYYGGFDFTLQLSQLTAIMSKPWAFVVTGNTVLNREDRYPQYWVFNRIYKPSEILHHFALCIRICEEFNSPFYGYTENSWCPEVLDNGEFTGNLLNGDLTEGDVQPWQWTNINVNTFTEDDVPEYEPPSPSGDETDSGGDDIRTTDWTVNPVSAANNFITLYGLNYKTLADFGQKMWASLADPDFWKMVGTAFTNDFSINPADMMKYFVSLRFFPFDLSELNHTLASGIYIGRAATPISPTPFTGIPSPIRLTNNIAQLSGGRLTIRRYYNDFRDFEPCTTVQIHVPFCGSVDVPASEVMGHEMDLTYKIDLQTGAMLAVLGVASNTYYVIATLAGTCGATIPITANNNIEFLQRIATVGSGLIGGGVSGAVKGATVGGEVGAVVGAVAGTVGGGVGALAGLPPVTVHKQGNASGFANLGGVPYAYATVQRGRFERPDNYGHTTGFACDFSATIGSLSGFTVCDNVDTSGLTCNADERDEIKRLLESGVYV